MIWWDRVLLCVPGWLGNHRSPTASWALGFQIHTTIPGYHFRSFVLEMLFYFWDRILLGRNYAIWGDLKLILLFLWPLNYKDYRCVLAGLVTVILIPVSPAYHDVHIFRMLISYCVPSSTKLCQAFFHVACTVQSVAEAWHFYYLQQGQQTFSVKGLIVNISSFVVHMVSVSITQLCHCVIVVW